MSSQCLTPLAMPWCDINGCLNGVMELGPDDSYMLPLEQSSNLKGTFVTAWIPTCPKPLISGNTFVKWQLLKCSFLLSTFWQSAIAVIFGLQR